MHGFCAACHGLPHPLRRSPTYLIQIPNRLYRDFAIEWRNKLCLPPIDFSAAACPGVISWAGWPWSRAARPWLWPAVPRPRPSLPPPPPRHRRVPRTRLLQRPRLATPPRPNPSKPVRSSSTPTARPCWGTCSDPHSPDPIPPSSWCTRTGVCCPTSTKSSAGTRVRDTSLWL